MTGPEEGARAMWLTVGGLALLTAAAMVASDAPADVVRDDPQRPWLECYRPGDLTTLPSILGGPIQPASPTWGRQETPRGAGHVPAWVGGGLPVVSPQPNAPFQPRYPGGRAVELPGTIPPVAPVPLPAMGGLLVAALSGAGLMWWLRR